VTKGEQIARVIDKAAAIVERIFYHTLAKVELRGSPHNRKQIEDPEERNCLNARETECPVGPGSANGVIR
jgi:hypothetical protein